MAALLRVGDGGYIDGTYVNETWFVNFEAPTSDVHIPVLTTHSLHILIAPQPVAGDLQLRLVLPFRGHTRVDLLDVSGRRGDGA